MMTPYQTIHKEIKQTCSCLLCSGTAELMEHGFPGYQDPYTFEIYYCTNCNTSFSTPRVETSHIYEYIYKNGNNVPAYKRYWHYLKEVKNHKDPLLYLSQKEEMYWVVRHSILEMSISKTVKIMEVGCGLGYLSYSLKEKGYDVTGLDISKNAVDEATKTFGSYYICADIFEYAPKHQNTYDVIILTEVIEHLNEPIKFLESIMLMLRNGGWIIVTTPNKTPFSSNVIWATELPPIHLWWFTEDSMKFIATKINMDVSFIDFSDFYKRKPSLIEIKKFTNKHPLLNRSGELINMPEEAGKVRSFLSRIPFLRLLNVKIKSAFKKAYVCGKRGAVIGAIFQKK